MAGLDKPHEVLMCSLITLMGGLPTENFAIRVKQKRSSDFEISTGLKKIAGSPSKRQGCLGVTEIEGRGGIEDEPETGFTLKPEPSNNVFERKLRRKIR